MFLFEQPVIRTYQWWQKENLNYLILSDTENNKRRQTPWNCSQRLISWWWKLWSKNHLFFCVFAALIEGIGFENSRWSHLCFPEGGRWWKSYHFMCSRLIHAAKLLLKLVAIISLPNAELWNKSSHPRGPNVFCVTQLGCFKPVALWEWWISSLRSSYSWCLRLTHLAVMDVSTSA